MIVDPWNWPGLIVESASGKGLMSGHASGMNTPANTTQTPKNSGFSRLMDNTIARIAPCPWSFGSGAHQIEIHALPKTSRTALYTTEQRRRRDSTAWTLVQGVLAPIQFLVFLVSLGLVLNYLHSGRGYDIAAGSVVVKTFMLYAIMITGAIWEKKVFDRYLFAHAFFWEDAVSMLVIALHSAYLAALFSGWGSADDRMLLALAAYLTYAINAAQFIVKFRAARLQATASVGYAQSGAR
jgi:3-vinyl bacteriochlorophyllide hydratase